MRLAIPKRGFAYYVLLLLRIASGPTANLSYILTAFYGLRSQAYAIEALFLSFVFTNLNTAIVPGASTANIARYLIVLLAFISVFGRDFLARRIALDRVSVVVLIFCGYGFIHAVLFSLFPVISMLKMIVWTLAFLTLLRGWDTLGETHRRQVARRIYMTLSTLVVMSVLVSVDARAYLPGTNLLQGLMNHSQALGSTATFVAIWSFMRAVDTSRPAWTDLGVFLIATLAVVESGARTALITLLFSLPCVVTLSFLKIGRLNKHSFIGLRSKRFFALALIGCFVVISQLGVIRDVLLKGTSEASGGKIELVNLYAISRGGLISEMWANIERDPIIGTGFGLASDSYNMAVTYLAGIPIGAIVEKGVTLIAIWEELGLIGLFLFIAMFLAIFFRAVSMQPLRVAIFIAIVMINFGEASLMSAGGIGLLQLVLIGWIISREQYDSEQQIMPRGTQALRGDS